MLYIPCILRDDYEDVLRMGETELKWDHGVAEWLAWMAWQPELPYAEEYRENVTSIDQWARTF